MRGFVTLVKVLYAPYAIKTIPTKNKRKINPIISPIIFVILFIYIILKKK